MCDSVSVQYRHVLYNYSSPERRHNPSIEDVKRVSKDVAVRLMVEAYFWITSASELAFASELGQSFFGMGKEVLNKRGCGRENTHTIFMLLMDVFKVPPISLLADWNH